MIRIIRTGLILVMGAMVIVHSGCGTAGTGQPAGEELFHHNALGEVGGLYESYFLDSKKPPAKLADVAKYETGLPTGYMELKSGNIIALWGARLSDGEVDKVFAYEKSTPQSGGFVLMADGKTIKKMTAEEFKSAPKAADLPSPEDAKKK